MFASQKEQKASKEASSVHEPKEEKKAEESSSSAVDKVVSEAITELKENPVAAKVIEEIGVPEMLEAVKEEVKPLAEEVIQPAMAMKRTTTTTTKAVEAKKEPAAPVKPVPAPKAAPVEPPKAVAPKVETKEAEAKKVEEAKAAPVQKPAAKAVVPKVIPPKVIPAPVKELDLSKFSVSTKASVKVENPDSLPLRDVPVEEKVVEEEEVDPTVDILRAQQAISKTFISLLSNNVSADNYVVDLL